MTGSIDKPYNINNHTVRHSFNVAAAGYDRFAVLQRTITDRLIENFDQFNIQPRTVLDLGSGTGVASRKLKRRFKKACFLQLDIAELMLTQARKQTGLFSKDHFVCADACAVPLQTDTVDLVFSALMLQWCNDIDAVFVEVQRVLRPGGVFVFASLGPDTLKELRASWAKADDTIHVNAFMDMHDVGDALIRNGLDAPVLSVESVVMTYDDAWQLMRELKGVGARNMNAGRRKTVTGKSRLQAMLSEYERFRRENKLPASFEVVYGHAWLPESEQTARRNPAEQSVSLADLRSSIKQRG